MIHRRLVAALLGLAAVGATSVTGCTALVGDDRPATLVVGVDLALTGRGSDVDIVYQQALQLRVEQLNQQRARSGGGPVELRVLDNRSDRGASVTNVADLAGNARVTAVITGSCAECLLDAVGDIDAAGVPTISLAAAGAVSEPVAERRWVFRIAPDAAGGADMMAAELASREVSTVAAVTSGDLYGSDGARELAAATDALGIDLVVHEELGAGADAEAMAQLAEGISSWQPQELDPFTGLPPDTPSGPDAVVVWTAGEQALATVAALRQAGYEGQVWLDAAAAGDLFVTDAELALALTDARLLFSETLVMDDVTASQPHQAERREWFDSYTARYGTYHAAASFAADALDTIVAAVDRVGSSDRTLVRDTFEATTLPGLSGPVAFSPGDHSGFDARALRVLRFAGDRWHRSTT